MQISTGLTGKHFSPAQGCLSFELINHRESCFPQCPPSGTQTQDAYLVKECFHRPLVPTTRHHEGNHLAGWQSLQRALRVFQTLLKTRKGPKFLLWSSCYALKSLSGKQVSPHPLTGRETRLNRAFISKSLISLPQPADSFFPHSLSGQSRRLCCAGEL